MNPLVLSTLPHYLAIVYSENIGYTVTILASSTLSVIWHAAGEPDGVLMYLDYSLAVCWFLYEVYLGKNKGLIILLNGLILTLNRLIPQENPQRYIFYHSIWHLLSSMKVIYIALVTQSQLDQRGASTQMFHQA
jgi:hypothetical protein